MISKSFRYFMLMATTASVMIPAFARSNVIRAVPGVISNARIDPKLNMTDIVPITPNRENDKKKEDVRFSADEMETNSEDGIITARGRVIIERNNVTVQADKVKYYQKEDRIVAEGNVVLLEPSGNVIYAERINLEDKMDRIAMEDIKVILRDKSYMAAKTFNKFKNDNKQMDNVVYTPCDFCESEDPLWQIKARKVRHDATSKDLNYNDAFLEIKGVPILYIPFFSHPDPTVKRRSGFLPPSFSTNNYFGAKITPKYFWDIDDHQNILLSPGYSSKIGPVMGADYNKYFYSGDLKLSGSYVKDNKNDDFGNGDRGHLYAEGRYEINDLWVSKFDAKYVSDRTYLRDMSLKERNDAWINSTASLERFEGRNYAAVETFYYKRVSYDLRQEDKPYIIPLISYENYGEVNEYGFYNKNEISMASVYREEEDSSYRASMINSWILPSTTSYGAKQRVSASLKTDLYYIDNYTNNRNENFDGGTARVFPQLAYEWRLPFVKATDSSRQIIEPIMVAVLAPNGGNQEDKIPNNDSRNPRLDDTNVLNINRYAGYDLNDTGSRVSYGINWSSYGDITGRSSFLLAQSYKFNRSESFSSNNVNSDNGNFSDYVGRMYANPHKYLDLNYRFILNRKDYDLDYSELSTRIGSDVLSTTIAYISLKDDSVYSISKDYSKRKELYISFDLALTQNWYLSVYNRQDLTKNGGSLEHGGSLKYEDECLIVSTNVRKDNSNDPDDKGNFEVTLDFYLKTLGGIGSN